MRYILSPIYYIIFMYNNSFYSVCLIVYFFIYPPRLFFYLMFYKPPSSKKGSEVPSGGLWALQWLRWSRIHLKCRRPRFDLWVRKIPWRRERQPTPVFLPGDLMDRGAWWATVHGVSESQTQLSNSTIT